jgi:hypothetical protein
VDPLSFDELYGHEMRIEQQFPAMELAQPYAHYTTRAAMLEGKRIPWWQRLFLWR